jgi:basic membrane lipoprotein Med (substrate-binding protein (PBP1-ABC) superfamily)
MKNHNGVVNLTLMDRPREQSADAFQSALRAARENENMWVAMSPEFTSDSERME